jgi:hypothetical protein
MMMPPTTLTQGNEDSNSDSEYSFIEPPSSCSDDEKAADITINAPTVAVDDAADDEQLLTLMAAMAPRRNEAPPPYDRSYYTYAQAPLWTSFATASTDDGRDVILDEVTLKETFDDVSSCNYRMSTSGVVFLSEDEQQQTITATALFDTNNSGKRTAEVVQLSRQMPKTDSSQQDVASLCAYYESIAGLEPTVLRDEVAKTYLPTIIKHAVVQLLYT